MSTEVTLDNDNIANNDTDVSTYVFEVSNIVVEVVYKSINHPPQ